ncbi:glycosyl hydrolases family 31 protein [Glomus cerebriforme]|uniref:Maltase n=1 Tax=Glomus cerebriforme TaxID=658196 RepID=A0A397TGL6_9GLOM|nr:glycosyl hydrolases family 31 protein [Glomus cerebriforme]
MSSNYDIKLNIPKNNKNIIPEFGADINDLSLTVEYQTPYRIRVCISDVEEKRWRIPDSVVPLDKARSDVKEFNYDFGYENNPFGFYVNRKSDGEKVFDTISERFIFKDQYIEISTKLPKKSNIYGLGEITGPLKREEGKRTTIWTRDAPCPVGENVYGAHPFYMELRKGKAHGVFLFNSNGMDILYEDGKLTYKVIGGILDFYIFLGPSPIEVVEQYSELIGYPCLIPYWSLGFHQCRWGYNTILKLEDMVDQYKEAKIPMDVVWIDIDYMDSYKLFTYDPTRFPVDKFSEFVAKLHQNHQKFVAIVDPGVKVEKGYKPYDEGVEKNLFIKRADGKDYMGKVWPGITVFPDWFHPEVEQYWTESFRHWLSQVPIDGIWIDMNEIASFIDGDLGNLSHQVNEVFIPTGDQTVDDMANTVVNRFSITQTIKNLFSKLVCIITFKKYLSVNNPPYAINNAGIEAPLFTRTSPMDAFHHTGITEYNAHNLFGHMEASMTHRALRTIRPEKRPFILSRSTFPSSGRYTAHWLGDNYSQWDNLIHSIPGMLAFQLFSIPLVGADICGFNGKCEEELAIRWIQLGAFYPFSRNHNMINMPGQECYQWEKVKQISKNWLEVRYTLLPYWYTTFYHAAIKGTPVLRPLWFMEPENEDTWNIDQQFLVGEGLLITPVTTEKAIKVKGYYPSGIWYDFFTGVKLLQGDKGQWKEIDAPLEIIPVHIHGGKIIPLHCRASLTTFESRANGIKLLVALDKEGKAKGGLYLDDGETPLEQIKDKYTFINFIAEDFALKCNGIFGYEDQGTFIDEIIIFGTSKYEGQLIVKIGENEKSIEKENIEWEKDIGKLAIKGLGIDLKNGGFTLSYK